MSAQKIAKVGEYWKYTWGNNNGHHYLIVKITEVRHTTSKFSYVSGICLSSSDIHYKPNELTTDLAEPIGWRNKEAGCYAKRLSKTAAFLEML